MKKTAVILINLGTPEAPTAAGVSQFLKSFLSDYRVVETPKLPWWFILRCIVIPLRAKKVAKAYKEIWWDEGSPIKVISNRQVNALQNKMNAENDTDIPIIIGAATYGNPSLKETITTLSAQGVERFVIVPMYPQYSGSTTGAIYDQVADIIQGSRNVADITTIKSFYDDPGYIESLVNSVTSHWQQQGRKEKLLMSFHGIPQEYADKGDPYQEHCSYTANALAANLGLNSSEWAMGFQSRFGPKKWLQPYIDKQLVDWVNKGVKSVDIISPAFTADCLETLEELNISYRKLFLDAGGSEYSYIPCVNDSPLFIDALSKLVKQRLY
jgi:ferrochelatase